MTVREHEAVAQRPGGISGIEAQVLVPELEGRPRKTHGGAGVAGFLLLHHLLG